MPGGAQCQPLEEELKAQETNLIHSLQSWPFFVEDTQYEACVVPEVVWKCKLYNMELFSLKLGLKAVVIYYFVHRILDIKSAT